MAITAYGEASFAATWHQQEGTSRRGRRSRSAPKCCWGGCATRAARGSRSARVRVSAATAGARSTTASGTRGAGAVASAAAQSGRAGVTHSGRAGAIQPGRAGAIQPRRAGATQPGPAGAGSGGHRRRPRHHSRRPRDPRHGRAPPGRSRARTTAASRSRQARSRQPQIGLRAWPKGGRPEAQHRGPNPFVRFGVMRVHPPPGSSDRRIRSASPQRPQAGKGVADGLSRPCLDGVLYPQFSPGTACFLSKPHSHNTSDQNLHNSHFVSSDQHIRGAPGSSAAGLGSHGWDFHGRLAPARGASVNEMIPAEESLLRDDAANPLRHSSRGSGPRPQAYLVAPVAYLRIDRSVSHSTGARSSV